MSDTSTRKFQRRTVLVKKTLQLKYIAVIFASVLAAAALIGLDLYYTLYKIVLMDNPMLTGPLDQIRAMLFLKLGLYLGIIFLVSLFLSHRLAGPIYRFEKSAQAVGSGDLTHRVSLRTGDELVELQEEFNAMVAGLQSLVQKDRTLARRLAGRVQETARRLSEDGADPATARAELLSLKAELDHITSSFKA